MTQDVPSRTEQRPLAGRVLMLLFGGLVTLVFAPGTVDLLRDDLHVGCSYGTMGEADGSWFCSDGIGYLFPGAGLLSVPGLALICALALLPARFDTIGRVLTALAFVPLAWVAALTASVTVARSDALPAGVTWSGVWLVAVGLPLLGCLLCATVVAARRLLPAALQTPATIVGLAALLLLGITSGLAIAAVPACALLVAGDDQPRFALVELS